ncbi:MAG: ATP-binding protein [bacterium]|nr:ATP-binding protein [bacterium]
MAQADQRKKITRKNLLLLILLILFINFFGWVFFLSIRETFDEELGYRLVYIANTAALLIDGTTVSQFKSGDESKPEYRAIQTQLIKIKYLDALREIFIINRDLQTFVDANTTVPIGYANRLLEVDASEIESAWTGLPQASILYSLKRNFYKRGYAPIRNKENRVVAVLGIEAGAHFSRAIIRIRNSLLLMGIVSLILIIATITTMNRLYTTLWKFEKQVLSAEKYRAVGQLAAGVAHEIRNPLGITRGTAELLKDELDNREKALTRVNDIITEVDRMNLIITNFLEFSRSAPLQVTEQNIHELINKTLQLCQYQLEQAQIVCKKEFASDLPAVKLDGQQMIQVFLNIILNARDAMSKGGTLTIKTRADKKQISIEIRDTGIGISPNQQTHLFEPFYSPKREGIGLGLTISKRIIEDHLGKIEIKSELNKGTTVYVSLPI